MKSTGNSFYTFVFCKSNQESNKCQAAHLEGKQSPENSPGDQVKPGPAYPGS